MAGTLQRPGGGGDGDLEDEFPEPPRLRLLRRMVTGLMAVMGLGMIVIAGTVVWRLGVNPPSAPVPAPVGAVSLPAGFAVEALGGDGPHVLALGRGADGAERLLTIDRNTGEILGDAPVARR